MGLMPAVILISLFCPVSVGITLLPVHHEGRTGEMFDQAESPGRHAGLGKAGRSWSGVVREG